MPDQRRRPAGSPAGGQFASGLRSESNLELPSAGGQTNSTAAAESVPVPAIGHESQTWNPPVDYGLTARERAARGRTYRSAIPATLADLELTIPVALAAEAEEAAAEIARFDQSTEHALGTLTAVLLRSESASSSQIEQISASARAIAEAELTGHGSGNAEAVVDNVQAMTRATTQIDTLTAESIADIQQTLLDRQSPQLVGWRTEPVWIGGAGSTPMTADFVAPDQTRIHSSISDLVAFAARDDLPVLPQIAIAHAQFETIHPFADGNGRTGRALVQVMLRSKRLTRAAIIPLSGGLLVDKDRYFAALGAYRDGDGAPIIDQFTHAALRAVHHGRQLATDLTDLRQAWQHSVKARADSTAWKILDLIPAHPVVDAETVAENTGIHPNNVRRAVAPLVEAGILVGRQHYKSHKYLYRSPQVLALLDDYAADIGRRQR